MQPDVGQPRRLWVRQWPEQHRVHNAEDCTVSSDADSQRKHHQNGQAGVLTQHAERTAEIVQHRVHVASRADASMVMHPTGGHSFLNFSLCASPVKVGSDNVTMKVLVIDVGGTHVKLLATARKIRAAIPSGPAMTPTKMVK